MPVKNITPDQRSAGQRLVAFLNPRRSDGRSAPAASQQPAHVARASSPSVLADLLSRPAAAPPAVEQPARPARRRIAGRARPAAVVRPAPARPARRARQQSWAGQFVGYLAALTIAGALWLLDGYFSLLALKWLGMPIVVIIDWPWAMSTSALLVWLIPLAIEAIEQALITADGWLFALFVLISGLNVIATGYGIYVAYQLRLTPEVLAAAVLVGGLVLAFGPGRVLVEAGRRIIDLVRYGID